MTDEIEMTDDDRQLAHTLIQHVLLEGASSLAVAYAEVKLALEDGIEDERFDQLSETLQTVLEQIEIVVNDLIDTIPGTLSREEAELLQFEQEFGEFFPYTGLDD